MTPVRIDTELEGKMYRPISEVSEMVGFKPHVLRSLGDLYPEALGESQRADDDALDRFRERYARGTSIAVKADNSGFLRLVDEHALSSVLPDGVWAIIYPRVGDYVLRDSVLVEFGGIDAEGVQLGAEIRGAFALDIEH